MNGRIQNQIQAVIFDMDGVLLDSEAVYAEGWRIAGEKKNLRGIDAFHKTILGLSEQDTIAALKKFYGHDFDGAEFWNLTTEISVEIMNRTGVPEKPFARTTLESLKRKNIRLALASSSSRAIVQYLMEKAGLMEFFDVAICGDEIKNANPDPEIYTAACMKLNLSTSECIAVEDSPNGVKSAVAAGLKCIMIPDRVQPDESIRKAAWKVLSSLKDIINLPCWVEH